MTDQPLSSADVAEAGREWVKNAPEGHYRSFGASFLGVTDTWQARSSAIVDGEIVTRYWRWRDDELRALGRAGLLAHLDALEAQWGNP